LYLAGETRKAFGIRRCSILKIKGEIFATFLNRHLDKRFEFWRCLFAWCGGAAVPRPSVA